MTIILHQNIEDNFGKFCSWAISNEISRKYSEFFFFEVILW
jgi:hypothetical protein